MSTAIYLSLNSFELTEKKQTQTIKWLIVDSITIIALLILALLSRQIVPLSTTAAILGGLVATSTVGAIIIMALKKFKALC